MAVRDVRMRGFADRADVEDVDAYLRGAAAALAAEDVEMLACRGRVLACDVVAPVDVRAGTIRSPKRNWPVEPEWPASFCIAPPAIKAYASLL